MLTLSGFADRGGAPRRSPIEIVATMGSYLTRTPAADPSQDGYRDWARARLSVVGQPHPGIVDERTDEPAAGTRGRLSLVAVLFGLALAAIFARAVQLEVADASRRYAGSGAGDGACRANRGGHASPSCRGNKRLEGRIHRHNVGIGRGCGGG